MNRRCIFVLLVLSLSPTVAACGDDEASSQKSSTLRLDGTYRPVDRGPIGSITFTANKHYLLMPAGCTGGSCADIGTYRLDAAARTVTLENGVTHELRTIQLEDVRTSDVATALVQSLAPRDLVEPGTQLARPGGATTEGQGQTTEGQGQATGGQQQLAEKAMQLIQQIVQALMNKQDMKKDDKKDEEKKDEEKKDEEKKEDCKAGVPNMDTPADETAAYWARCPNGP